MAASHPIHPRCASEPRDDSGFDVNQFREQLSSTKHQVDTRRASEMPEDASFDSSRSRGQFDSTKHQVDTRCDSEPLDGADLDTTRFHDQVESSRHQVNEDSTPLTLNESMKRLASSPPEDAPDSKRTKIIYDNNEAIDSTTPDTDNMRSKPGLPTTSLDEPSIPPQQTQINIADALANDATLGSALESASKVLSTTGHDVASVLKQILSAVENSAIQNPTGKDVGEGNVSQGHANQAKEPTLASQPSTGTIDQNEEVDIVEAPHSTVAKTTQGDDQTTAKAGSASREPSTSPATLDSTPATAVNQTQSDDEDLKIISVNKVTTPKRTTSLTPVAGPAKKSSSKTGVMAKNGKKSASGAKGSTMRPAGPAQAGRVRGKANAAPTNREPEADGTEDEDSSSEETEDDDESDYEERAKQASRNALNAEQRLGKACRNCKINANREWKTLYKGTVKKLNFQRKSDERKSKQKANEDAKNEKARADREKKEVKEKHEGQIKTLKGEKAQQAEKDKAKIKEKEGAWKRKYEDLRTKLEGDNENNLKAWQKKYNEMKTTLEQRNKRLTEERDSAEAQRKSAEKDCSERVKKAQDAQIVAERSSKERVRGMKRQLEEGISELKPEHSTQLKLKDRDIAELEQNVIDLKGKLKEAHKDYHSAGSNARENQIRNEEFQAKLSAAKEQTASAKKHLREFEQYAKQVNQRSESKVARAEEAQAQAEAATTRAEAAATQLEERLKIEVANAFDQKQHLVHQQRINLQTKETLRVQAQLSREKSLEIAALKAELERMKAEAGLSADTDRL